APEGPLRYWRLLEVHQPSVTPLLQAALSVDERILHFVEGSEGLDDRLELLVTRRAAPLPEVSDQVPDSQRLVLERLRGHLPAGRDRAAALLVQLLGSDPASK